MKLLLLFLRGSGGLLGRGGLGLRGLLLGGALQARLLGLRLRLGLQLRDVRVHDLALLLRQVRAGPEPRLVLLAPLLRLLPNHAGGIAHDRLRICVFAVIHSKVAVERRTSRAGRAMNLDTFRQLLAPAGQAALAEATALAPTEAAYLACFDALRK